MATTQSSLDRGLLGSMIDGIDNIKHVMNITGPIQYLDSSPLTNTIHHVTTSLLLEQTQFQIEQIQSDVDIKIMEVVCNGIKILNMPICGLQNDDDVYKFKAPIQLPYNVHAYTFKFHTKSHNAHIRVTIRIPSAEDSISANPIVPVFSTSLSPKLVLLTIGQNFLDFSYATLFCAGIFIRGPNVHNIINSCLLCDDEETELTMLCLNANTMYASVDDDPNHPYLSAASKQSMVLPNLGRIANITLRITSTRDMDVEMWMIHCNCLDPFPHFV